MNEGSTIAMETGTQFLRIVSPFYFVISLKLMADGVLRGAGAMKSFMIATFTDLFLRVILAFLLSVRFGTMGIWLSWPIGWTIAMALSLFFYKKGCVEDRFFHRKGGADGGSGHGTGVRERISVSGRIKHLKNCPLM